MHEHHYIVIVAGGSGTRLWPLSRKSNPKQFHRLTSKKTLLEETYDRAKLVVSEDRIFISTTSTYVGHVRTILPEISEDHLIIEPLPQGTAPAIALIAKRLYQSDPEAVVATLVSDHAIRNPDEFANALLGAFEAAEKRPETITTIGINPTFPSTELGYIKMGEEATLSTTRRTFFVEAFKEKPDVKTAKRYLAGWEYLWNAGYFVFRAENFLAIAKELIPQTMGKIEAMSAIDPQDPEYAEKASELYSETINEPIDTAIIEKLPVEKRLVIPSELEWSDIGGWKTLFDFLRKDDADSLVSQGKHIDFGSKECLVFGKEKLIATLGLENIVIVQTSDAILVADKSKTNEIKKLLEKVKEERADLM